MSTAKPQLTVEDVEALVEEKVKSETAELRQENEQLREENEELRERIDELEKQNQIVQSRCDGLESLIERLEERLDSGDLADDVQDGADPDIPRETPLEDVVALPDDVADRELAANVQRARWFASRIASAGKKVPVGYQLPAGEIGRLLDVAVDVDPHPETVARIISILDEMGDDGATRRKKNGEKRIIVDEDLAKRLKAHSEMRREE